MDPSSNSSPKNSELFYPSSEAILEWGRLLEKSEGGELQGLLPFVDEEWAAEMRDCFEVNQLHPDHDIVSASARLFHRITKNHRLVDGNKRSAVICTYLFIFGNGHNLKIAARNLYELTRHVAEDEASPETAVNVLKRLFSEFIANETDAQ
ncbi:type II toxin-antitoxin system death-on-curing family toxin [Patescibacteria group bacterium]|nr:MAG: type II toxin-antitoxin system death-on-curing family toxin [Patescibacteria group bacterium]